ncbi:hypothetical protein C8R41DRAFT_781895 [Lentinula lateritia]|uniref:MFS general substrate transporter n=1 Tax=Lentinula lateritia TaxID=40482 RepID=A0ABQ8UXX4_9AGAR|nr:hypothetical protein C8R41DRAFT_781895 [Lentinula lateritia]
MACASDNNLESVELALQIPLPTSSSTLDLNSSSVSVVLQSDIPSVDSVASIHRNQSSLPPVDRGFGAWSFLTAAFFVEAIVWGFPTSFGVFLDGVCRIN